MVLQKAVRTFKGALILSLEKQIKAARWQFCFFSFIGCSMLVMSLISKILSLTGVCEMGFLAAVILVLASMEYTNWRFLQEREIA